MTYQQQVSTLTASLGGRQWPRYALAFSHLAGDTMTFISAASIIIRDQYRKKRSENLMKKKVVGCKQAAYEQEQEET